MKNQVLSFLVLAAIPVAYAATHVSNQDRLETNPPPAYGNSQVSTKAEKKVLKDKNNLAQKLREDAPVEEIHKAKQKLQQDRTHQNRAQVLEQIRRDQHNDNIDKE